ncbi:MAG: hypothetical protein ABIJ56_06700 [Pseudomonadota bacterium]
MTQTILVHREEDGGVASKRVNGSLIPADFTRPQGSRYLLDDADIAPGQDYFYTLEIVFSDGSSEFLGPVSVKVEDVEDNIETDGAGRTAACAFIESPPDRTVLVLLLLLLLAMPAIRKVYRSH